MNKPSPLPFLLIFTLPLGVVVGEVRGFSHLLTPFFVFVAIPLVDLFIGVDKGNPAADAESGLGEDRRFRYITWLCAAVQVAMVIWGAWLAGRGGTGWGWFASFTVAVGIVSGVLGINVSHELQHRVNSRLEVMLSRAMLVSVCYAHWAVEHVAGHHRWVATPHDPATARLGQSFYAFWPQTVFGGFKSSWRIESERLTRTGRGTFSTANRILRYLVFEVCFAAALFAAFGSCALVFFIGQSLVAITLLEAVNYIEHYGLLRARDENGNYEKVTPLHSWNNSCRVTNWYLFNLQRHSDHHADPRRRYQVLRHFDESPQLPTGYAGMILIALVPPLWRKIMDKKVPAGQNL